MSPAGTHAIVVGEQTAAATTTKRVAVDEQARFGHLARLACLRLTPIMLICVVRVMLDSRPGEEEGMRARQEQDEEGER